MKSKFTILALSILVLLCHFAHRQTRVSEDVKVANSLKGSIDSGGPERLNIFRAGVDSPSSGPGQELQEVKILRQVPFNDPFPQLEAFKKLLSHMGVPIKNGEEEARAIKTIIKYNPEYQQKLVSFQRNHAFDYGERFTKFLRAEIAQHQSEKLVFQDRKVYSDIWHPAIDPALPICILQVESSKVSSVSHDRFVIWIARMDHPVSGDRNFRGFRIYSDGSNPNDIVPRMLDCGFISNSEPNDNYLQLEAVHLYATIGFKR